MRNHHSSSKFSYSPLLRQRVRLLALLFLSFACRPTEAFLFEVFNGLIALLVNLFCALPLLGWIFCGSGSDKDNDNGNNSWQYQLIGSDIGYLDAFGTSVDLSSDTIVVGAPSHGGKFQGGVYVFEYNKNSETNQIQWIYKDDHLRQGTGESYEYFGRDVAIDGDTIVAGAPGRGNSTTKGRDSGVVQVFGRNFTSPEGWTLQQDIYPPPNDAENFFFGTFLDLDADLLVVGSPLENEKRGAVYIYVRDKKQQQQQWFLETRLTSQKNSTASVVERFGFNVALDGNMLAVGAPGYNQNQGTVYMYQRDEPGVSNNNTAEWVLQDMLFPDDNATTSNLGSVLALSGNTIAATSISPAEGNSAGAVYVFARNSSGKWTRQAKLQVSDMYSERRFFGQCLALDGGTLIVGAPRDDIYIEDLMDEYVNQGSVYEFARTTVNETEMWIQQRRIVGLDGDPGDNFGASCVMQGTRLVVGAPEQDGIDDSYEDTGAAYVIDLSYSPPE